ncbi:arylamine N-acetyltransferase family protein [Acinetobacter sp. WZC-1]|uniref:arylamine N-acetyltransferase family protein n=1 Tax=Acinetobacter sp. WZC-1 TaxID=3459034 RepID=UPI00403DFF0C
MVTQFKAGLSAVITPLPPSDISSAWLKKLGIQQEIVPDLENLKKLLALHLQNIPFGNLASFLNDQVSLAVPDIVHKLLVQGREGYCLEHNTLTQLVLNELGYQAYNTLGRVYYQQTGIQAAPVRTHLVTIIQLEEGLFLFDPGFGGMTPNQVLSLQQTGQSQSAPLEPYRFIAAEDSGIQNSALTEMKLMLQTYVRDEWVNIYAINPEQSASASDASLANWYISTSPESLFTRQLMLARVTSEARIALKNNTLQIHGKHGSSKQIIETQQDLEQMLESLFRIHLSQTDSEKVFKKIRQISEHDT